MAPSHVFDEYHKRDCKEDMYFVASPMDYGSRLGTTLNRIADYEIKYLKLSNDEGNAYKREIVRIKDEMVEEDTLEGMCRAIRGAGYRIKPNGKGAITLYHSLKSKQLDSDVATTLLGPVARQQGIDVKQVYTLAPYTMMPRVLLKHKAGYLDARRRKFMTKDQYLKQIKAPHFFEHELGSFDVMPLYGLGVHLLLVNDDSKTAKQCFDLALDKDSGCPQVHYLMANLHFKNNSAKQGLRHLETASRIANKNLFLAHAMADFADDCWPAEKTRMVQRFNTLSRTYEHNPEILKMTLQAFKQAHIMGLKFSSTKAKVGRHRRDIVLTHKRRAEEALREVESQP